MRDPIAVRLEGLPGGETIAAGLADLREGRESVGAYLVAIAATRLRGLGLAVPPSESLPPDAELALYRLLRQREGDGAYSRYNAYLRLLVSFARALDRQVRRQRG